MPRLQLRLATLALLIVIIALATALFVRETAMKSHVKALKAENAAAGRILKRLQVTRQRELNELGAQAARSSGEGKDAGRDRPTDHGEDVAPKD